MQYKLHFQREAKLEQSIAIVTTRSVSWFFLYRNRNDMEKHSSLYFFFSPIKRSKRQTSVLLKNIAFLYTNHNNLEKYMFILLLSSLLLKDWNVDIIFINIKFPTAKIILLNCRPYRGKEVFLPLQWTTRKNNSRGW